MADYSYSRELRLLTPADFESVFNGNPQKAVSPQLTFLAIPNTHNKPRFGFIIAKKKVRTAVARNRIKRIIRENIRHLQHKLPAIDIVIIAKHGVDRLTNEELHDLAKGLCKTISRRCKKQ